MEIILLERIDRLGQMGDVVKVKDGYARNFLLPKRKALRASKENLDFFEKEKVNLEARNLKEKSEAEKIQKKLNEKNFVIIRQAGETGQLYGSVSTNNIKDALKDEDITNMSFIWPCLTYGAILTLIIYHSFRMPSQI